jgi:DoxX-like family
MVVRNPLGPSQGWRHPAPLSHLSSPRRHTTVSRRSRILVYWATTLAVAYEMVAGSMWDLLRIEYVRVTLTHLGYPLYLLLILGVWKLPCAVVLLIPRFERLKEWTYAGAFFNYSGAVASHLFVGDRLSVWIWPLVFALLTLVSWAVRPSERRLVAGRPAVETPAREWAVPLVIVVVMLVVALLTLPEGSPPL